MSRILNPSKASTMPTFTRRHTEQPPGQHFPIPRPHRSTTFNLISLSREERHDAQSTSVDKRSNTISFHDATPIQTGESINNPVEQREVRPEEVVWEDSQRRGSSFLHTHNFYRDLINKDEIEESLIEAEKQAKRRTLRGATSARSSIESVTILKREMTRIEEIIDTILRSQITLVILAMLIAIDTLVVLTEISLEYYVIKTVNLVTPDVVFASAYGGNDHVVKEVLHILHYVGISLMSVFAIDAFLRILILRGEFFHEKHEVIDAIVVYFSLITEVLILTLDWESEIVSTLVLLLLRITRVVLGILKNVSQKAEMRIYYLKKSRASAKERVRLMEEECNHLLQNLYQLEKLARQYEAKEEEIIQCRPARSFVTEPTVRSALRRMSNLGRSMIAGVFSSVASHSVDDLTTVGSVFIADNDQTTMQLVHWKKRPKASSTSSIAEEVFTRINTGLHQIEEDGDNLTDGYQPDHQTENTFSEMDIVNELDLEQSEHDYEASDRAISTIAMTKMEKGAPNNPPDMHSGSSL